MNDLKNLISNLLNIKHGSQEFGLFWLNPNWLAMIGNEKESAMIGSDESNPEFSSGPAESPEEAVKNLILKVEAHNLAVKIKEDKEIPLKLKTENCRGYIKIGTVAPFEITCGSDIIGRKADINEREYVIVGFELTHFDTHIDIDNPSTKLSYSIPAGTEMTVTLAQV